MAKKKVNPNKIPVSISDDVLEQMKLEATQDMSIQIWAIFLAALTSFSGTSADSLLALYDQISNATTKIRDFDSTRECLSDICKLAGATMELKKVRLEVHTQGDLDRLRNRLRKNSQAASFAIILDPVISQELLPEEDTVALIRKMVSLNEEIEEGRITVEDIQEMLREEYHLELGRTENLAVLSRQE